MRETEFRGKTIEENEFCFGDLVHYNEKIGIKVYNADIGTPAYTDFVIPETVGQYIQTVNNHRIFTGDIVKAYKHGDTESKPFIYEITERVGTYWFGNWTWLEFLNIFRYVEVIGNSIDNPELLEVKE